MIKIGNMIGRGLGSCVEPLFFMGFFSMFSLISTCYNK